ncbi:hypothetical protein HDC33_000907 [Sporosarcina sp. JAI121]|nr:hypothetical protein [Sporosarcina sp. JAI121]
MKGSIGFAENPSLTDCSEFGIMISRSDTAMYKRLKRKLLKRLNGILGKKTIA